VRLRFLLPSLTGADGSSSKDRLGKAKARLDTLAWYPGPVDITGVRVIVWPLWFRLFYPQFTGQCWGKKTILMRNADYSDDLLTHELCHCWQTQQDGYIKTMRCYLKYEYLENPYEQEARLAVALTR
jgi:hypothetical protein